MELLKDYDYTIFYYPMKVNVIIDALSCKSIGSLAYISKVKRPLIEEILRLEANGTKFEIKEPRAFLAHGEL